MEVDGDEKLLILQYRSTNTSAEVLWEIDGTRWFLEDEFKEKKRKRNAKNLEVGKGKGVKTVHHMQLFCTRKKKDK